MGKKRDRSKESDSPRSPVAAGRHKALCLGRDCDYRKELRRLQIALVKLQEWVRHKGLRVVARPRFKGEALLLPPAPTCRVPPDGSRTHRIGR